MTRIKTVYPADMVCHLWANGHGHDVRTSTGNVFTESGVLYSYGRHYAIGAFVTNSKGDRLLLWNSRGYSATTAQHTAKAYRALSVQQSRELVRVPELSGRSVGDIPGLAFACLMSARDPLQKCEKARDRLPVYMADAARWLTDARRLYEFAGMAKQARAVPVLAPDACKADAARIYSEMVRDEWIKNAATESENAARAFSLAESMASESGRYSARGIMRELSRAVRHIETGQNNLKRAGRGQSAKMRALLKQCQKMADQFGPLARAEELAQMRADIGDRVKNAVRELADYRRMRKARKFNNAALWAISKLKDEFPPKLADEKQARAIWGKRGPAELDYINAIISRGDRIGAFNSLARNIATVRDQIKNHHLSPDAAPVPNPRTLANYARAAGAESLPYWSAIVGPLVAECERIEKARADRIAQINADKIARWRAGESVTLPRDVGPLVRIVGDTVATSWGATVPLSHAARLLKLARIIQARGGQKFADGSGPSVGYFRVSFIGADFRIIIGCHEFSPDESENAARLIAESVNLETVN